MKKMVNQKKASFSLEELLSRGVDRIYPSYQALIKVLQSGKKLRLYWGIDPTGEKVHIGHTVALWKLKQFQDLGHKVFLLIGDFTAMIGDPSGKIKGARKLISHDEVLKNARTYKEQIAKILRFTPPNPVEMRYNSEWLAKMSAIDFLRLADHVTFQQIIKRDLFKKRQKAGEDIFVNEFMYPLLQGYDSVVLDVDIEIGGSDQLFNMLVGRDLMKKVKEKEKFVLTVPLLTDEQGNKIGKTEGNVIGITDQPNELYGKIMNLPDSAIGTCFELVTPLPWDEVKKIKKKLLSPHVNPMDFKKKLARILVAIYHSEAASQKAEEYFERVFQKKQLPKQLPSYTITETTRPVELIDLLVKTTLVSSRSQAKRLIKQKAVDVDGFPVEDIDHTIIPHDGMVVRAGKRKFVKLNVKR